MNVEKISWLRDATLINKVFILFVFLMNFSCLTSQSHAKMVITGKVVGVVDGDTVTVFQNNTQYRIRLYGIDTPEKG